jgi:hypothetical protein
VVEWLWDLDTRFGGVSLHCDPGSFLPLQADQAPFDPDLIRSVEFARERIRETCAFEGLLPVGTYRLHDRALEVRSQEEVLVVDLRGLELDRRTRRMLRRDGLAER